MKKLTLILIVILALGSLTARAQFSKMRAGEDTIKLDKVNYRITYQAKQVNDSTSSILGYNCQLAKAHFKGRTWYAWYAEDIPISEGPWKLYGLPGLILRAYDSQQQFYLNAIGLQDLKGKEDMKYAKPNKAEKISQADLTKVKLRDDMAEMLRASEIKITDENGKATKIKSRKPIFNPIER